MLAGARQHSGGLYLFIATLVANVFAYGYQVVMARLLRPEEFAVLTALFGFLVLQSISSQVIQSATARLAAQYLARGEQAALDSFVRRWSVRVMAGAASVGLIVALLSGPIAGALALPAVSVALLGLTLFLALVFTFGLGLLQGIAHFVWMGTALMTQSAARLVIGVTLVVLGFGVDGAFSGATAAIGVSLLALVFPLLPLFRGARSSNKLHELGPAETRFFALTAVVLIAYAALTNVDALLARPLLRPEDAGAYAGAITMGKIILFAPMAVTFLLLERTARAHARGEDTDRALYLALAFVLATSGLVAGAYVVLPEFIVPIVVGSQYPETAKIVGTYGVAALANALLSQWIAYFIGRGEMRVGLLLAFAVVAEVVLLITVASDPLTMARIVLFVALATQVAAVTVFFVARARDRRPTRST